MKKEYVTVADLIKLLSKKSVPQDALIGYDDEKTKDAWTTQLIEGVVMSETKDGKPIIMLYGTGKEAKLKRGK